MVSLSTQRLINKQKQNPCSLIQSRKKKMKMKKPDGSFLWMWILPTICCSSYELFLSLSYIEALSAFTHPTSSLFIVHPSPPSLLLLFYSIQSTPPKIKIKIASQINKFPLFIKSFVFCFGCCFCWYMKLGSQYHQLVLPCFISCFLFSLVICIRCFHKLV